LLTLRLIKRQHVQRGVAFQQLIDVIFQQRADHQADAILLRLRQNLVQRLREVS
jgi:hypothetical protein